MGTKTYENITFGKQHEEVMFLESDAKDYVHV